MHKWEPSLVSGDFLSFDLSDPIYGFQYEKNTVIRNISAADTEGFSQFQPSLLEHKNDSNNIEYNPLDVFINAMRMQQSSSKPKQSKPTRKTINTRSGYILYNQEMRPILQRHNPDLNFGDISKQIAQMWKELSSTEQEDFCQRARLQAIAQGGNPGEPNQQDLYFNSHNEDGMNMGDGTGYNLNIGTNFQS